MFLRFALAIIGTASLATAQTTFGLGCYNPGIRRCGCGPDECRKDLCEAKGFFWIEPSPNPDPNQPAAGCSLETRCQDDELCPLEPTEAPVEPTESPVEPTEAPVEPQDPCAKFNCKKCFGKKASNKKKCRVYVAPGETTSSCISKDNCNGLPGTCYKRNEIVTNKKGKPSPDKACKRIKKGESPLA